MAIFCDLLRILDLISHKLMMWLLVTIRSLAHLHSVQSSSVEEPNDIFASWPLNTAASQEGLLCAQTSAHELPDVQLWPFLLLVAMSAALLHLKLLHYLLA